MLTYDKQQLDKKNINNVKLVHTGFLTYDYPQEYFDGIASGLALDHLPVTWKAIALRKVFKTFRPGGQFILLDVVFDWKDDNYPEYFDRITTESPSSCARFEQYVAKNSAH